MYTPNLSTSPRATEREGRADRRRLLLGQRVDSAEQGAQELVQRGERKVRLDLDADGPEDREAFSALGRVLEQRRLADPGSPRSTSTPL